MVDGLETMVKVPYDGPFDLDIIHYRYIINKTKGVYYDREAMPKRGVTSRFDPLPMLMGSALGGLLGDGKPVPSFDGKNRWAAAPDGANLGDLGPGVAGGDLLQNDGTKEIGSLRGGNELHVAEETLPLLFSPDVRPLVKGYFEQARSVEHAAYRRFSCIHP